jgi:hypothetical protein
VEKVLDADRAPSWETTRTGREPIPAAGPGPLTQEVPAANGAGKLPRKPAELDPVRPLESALSVPVTSPATNLFTPNVKETVPLARREPEKAAQPSSPAEPPAANPTLPEDARRLAQQGRPSGRRRLVDDEAPVQPAAPEGEGRRHRADGEPPSWMQSPAADGATRRRAGHSRPELEPVPTPVHTGHRVAAEAGDEAGSHSAGRSVTELLAAHGSDTAAPRRRRRAAD